MVLGQLKRLEACSEPASPMHCGLLLALGWRSPSLSVVRFLVPRAANCLGLMTAVRCSWISFSRYWAVVFEQEVVDENLG